MDVVWDCIIVGGGAAGLSAGLVLGRARRRTLLVDAGAQSNLAAHGIGGLLGHDGRKPAELYEIGRRELSAYPSVEVRTGEVVAGERADDEFVLRPRRRPARAHATSAPRHGHGLPAACVAGPGGTVGPVGIPLPVLPRLGDA